MIQSLQMVSKLFSDVDSNTYHYYAEDATGNYNVWAEDGQADAFYTDNVMEIQVIEGTLDRFTKDEFDPKVEGLQRAMNNAGISWMLNSVQYEEKTGYIHYEWVWKVGDSVG